MLWLLNKGIGLEKLKELERASGDDTGEAYLGLFVRVSADINSL